MATVNMPHYVNIGRVHECIILCFWKLKDFWLVSNWYNSILCPLKLNIWVYKKLYFHQQILIPRIEMGWKMVHRLHGLLASFCQVEFPLLSNFGQVGLGVKWAPPGGQFWWSWVGIVLCPPPWWPVLVKLGLQWAEYFLVASSSPVLLRVSSVPSDGQFLSGWAYSELSTS